MNNYAKDGLKIITENNNLLVCKEWDGLLRFFYMTPQGDYIVDKHTEKTGKMLNFNHWNWLFERTQFSEKMTSDENRFASALIEYIVQDPREAWTVNPIDGEEYELGNHEETSENTEPEEKYEFHGTGIFENVPSFDLLKNLKFEN